MKGKRLIIFALAAVVLLWMTPHAFKPAAVQGAALEAPHWGVGGVPQFKIDPNWPKIPSKWKVGFGSDVFGDSKGNVWILSRPRRLPKGSPAAPPVMEFDQAGNFIQGWGGQSGPGYQWPSNEHGLFVDSKGFVWIQGNADGKSNNPDGLPNDNEVLKFTNDGKFVMAIGKSGMTGSNSTHVLRGATDIFVNYKNNEVYVSDGYGNSRIIVFNADTGDFVRMWGAYGHTPLDMDQRPPRSPLNLDPWSSVPEVLQQFGSPMHDVKISNDQLVYVADRGNKRVQVFTLDGKFLTEEFVGIDLPDLQARGLVFSNDPGQRFLYVGGTPDAWILNRRTLEILGTVKTVPEGPAGKSGQSNIGHFLGTDTNGNLYAAAELSEAFGKTQGAYRYNLTGYSPTTPCCQAVRDMSHAGGRAAGADAP
jgi:NHL repeat